MAQKVKYKIEKCSCRNGTVLCTNCYGHGQVTETRFESEYDYYAQKDIIKDVDYKITCSTCGGTGRVTCDICLGEGIYYAIDEPEPADSKYEKRIMCPICRGTGICYNYICDRCDGAGFWYWTKDGYFYTSEKDEVAQKKVRKTQSNIYAIITFFIVHVLLGFLWVPFLIRVPLSIAAALWVHKFFSDD